MRTLRNKISTGAAYSALNFALSLVGVVVSIRLVPHGEWALLGLILALLPVTSAIIFFQIQQYLLVEVFDNASQYVLSVVWRMAPFLVVSMPLNFVVYALVVEGDWLVCGMAIGLSVITALRVVQKYAWTLEANAKFLYMSNSISLIIWIPLLAGLYFANDGVTARDRLGVGLFGEVLSFILFANVRNQKKLTKITLPYRALSVNFFRLLLRQVNYNSPVYLVSIFCSQDVQSQIGLLARVRVVIDQLVNTVVVTLSKEITSSSWGKMARVGMIAIAPLIVVFICGVYAVSWLSSVSFNLVLLLWFGAVVVCWGGLVPYVLMAERKKQYRSLLVMELIFMLSMACLFVIVREFLG